MFTFYLQTCARLSPVTWCLRKSGISWSLIQISSNWRQSPKGLKGAGYQYHDNENNEQIKEISKRIRALKAQRIKNLRMQYREYYFESRPTWDIEQPGSGSNGDMMGMVNADDDLDRDFSGSDMPSSIAARRTSLPPRHVVSCPSCWTLPVFSAGTSPSPLDALP